MPRKKKIILPGLCYHVYARGNEKQSIFRDNSDRGKLVKILRKCAKKFKYKMYAYVFMPNHYHLLVEVPDTSLPDIMHYINSIYAAYFNWKYKRVGHLFQGSYQCQIVRHARYLPEVTRYIHLNPVKSSLCERLEEYRWSSYSEYCGKRGFKLANPAWMYECFGPDKSDAIKRYKMFIAEKSGPDAVESGMLGGLILGGSEFAKELGEKCGDMARVIKYRKPCGIIDADAVIAACALEFNVSQQEVICKKGKNNYAKSAAIYLVWKNSGKTYGEIGQCFNNLDASSVKRCVSRVKKEVMDNSALRNRLEAIERKF